MLGGGARSDTLRSPFRPLDLFRQLSALCIPFPPPRLPHLANFRHHRRRRFCRALSYKPPPSSEAIQCLSFPPSDTPASISVAEQMAIDYNHLIDQFGTKRIDDELLERFERLTGRKPHLLLRRGTFFSHRCVGKSSP